MRAGRRARAALFTAGDIGYRSPMASITYIVDATPENLSELVLENSRRGPVFVNDWAPWAGPCLKLWPVLGLLRRDRHHGDDAGRRAMLAVFHILGPKHPLVVQPYRGPLETPLF